MKQTIVLTLALAAALGALAGCETAREQFDFSKRAPDEFAVMRRAPLEIPSDLNDLPPPRPGAPRPQELATDQMARKTVIGEGAAPALRSDTQSQGESILLQKTGAANASGSIRTIVDEETARIAEEEAPGIDKIKKWVGQKTEAPAKVVDPVAEANRIQQNRAQGKPITEGVTPTIDR